MRALEPQATVRVPTLGAWRPSAKVGINYQRTYRSATPSRIYKRTLFPLSSNGPIYPDLRLAYKSQHIHSYHSQRPGVRRRNGCSPAPLHSRSIPRVGGPIFADPISSLSLTHNCNTTLHGIPLFNRLPFALEMCKRSSQTPLNDVSGLHTRPRLCKTYRCLAFYVQELQWADSGKCLARCLRTSSLFRMARQRVIDLVATARCLIVKTGDIKYLLYPCIMG
jgi:hypothetical protein